MIQNYLLIAWRNALRGKAATLITIAGLSSGLAVALLIGLWILDELSFNKSFKNYEYIAQVYHLAIVISVVTVTFQTLSRHWQVQCAR